jgi:two-component system LytT family response regulator
MERMRLLAVDDEPAAVNRLLQVIESIDGIEVVGVGTTGEEALELVQSLQPHLVVLDIQMPGLSGIDVARQLKGVGPDVVFVTATSEFGAEAFDLDAVDYLLKPYRADRLRETLQRARRRLGLTDEGPQAPTPAATGSDTVLWTTQREDAVAVPVRDIERIEASRDYVLLHTRTRSHLMRATMAELEKKLDPAELLRVHRSAFVRLAAVMQTERREDKPFRLHMRDGAVVVVGPSYEALTARALGLPNSRSRS